jgi:DNA-binding transcriptional MerR regulator
MSESLSDSYDLQKRIIMSSYKNKDIQELFDISADTVRVWSEEFKEYLSPLANPGSGRHRIFNDDDLSVFALVSSIKDKGLTYAEAHAALQAGQRGDVPELIEGRAIELQSNLELQIIKQKNEALQQERDNALQRVQNLQSQVSNLEGQLERADQDAGRVRSALDEARRRIEGLIKQIATLEVRLEMEKEKNRDTQKDDDK